MNTNGATQTILPAPSDRPDRDTFGRLIEPYRRELKLHCYRMLGSVHDADDVMQETLLRAWRGLDGFEGRASLRAWLYRIATNACLDAFASRANPHRILPDLGGPPSNRMPEGQPSLETDWLEPLPDSDLEGMSEGLADPGARYELGESVRLAFVAVIQQLPPRQRAVVLLRDVLGWSADEVALLLGGSVASVNSALQRARGTLAKHFPHGRPVAGQITDEQQRTLLDHYVRAWEHADLDGFVDLLRKDAIYRMPPWPHWYRGRDAIRGFFELAWRSYSSFRLMPTAANRQPALAAYSCGKGESTWRAHSIHLLELEPGSITSLTAFVRPLGPRLFPAFGLPAVFEPDAG